MKRKNKEPRRSFLGKIPGRSIFVKSLSTCALIKERLKGFLGKIFGRSIFAKFFSACALIMVVSFIVLGTALTMLSIRYSNTEKESLYLDNAKNISNTMVSINNNGQINYFLQTLSMSANNLDATIYICTNTGKIVTAVPPNGSIPNASSSESSRSSISKSVMNIINSRTYVKDESTLGGFFDTIHTNAGVPIISDGTVIGAIFISAKSGSSMKIIRGIVNIFIFCVIMILILAFIAIYFVTSRLVRPLRQMSNAAQSFSKGDFSAHIPVRSNDEIGQLAVAFNNMASSLSALEAMRSSFVANVSHELKTPMTSISGFIDGILDGTITQEKENHYLQIVSDEVKRLSRLVKSLLDVARIDAGEFKVNPTEFNVMELVRRVIIGFEQPIDAKALDIRGIDNDNKFIVSADFDLTYQIVYNLVDNAVKFANNGGYIEINIAAKSKMVFVSVKNSGMGIPETDLPYVFDRFYKTDKSRSRDRKGVGLGLYIVKTVLNTQGQDIVVKSIEGEFCEFVFTMKEVKA